METALDWSYIGHLIEKLKEQIDFEPDVVLGLSRGGLIPAIAMSHHFEVPLEIAFCSTYVNKEKVRKAKVLLPMLNRYNRILIVDDIFDTGDTLEEVEDKLMIAGTYVFKSAVLVSKSKDNPDYSVIKVPKKTWVKFPWEK
jgi:hypoxanthine phosphoribosyltransferase